LLCGQSCFLRFLGFSGRIRLLACERTLDGQPNLLVNRDLGLLGCGYAGFLSQQFVALGLG
jgi:hypothetical protein